MARGGATGREGLLRGLLEEPPPHHQSQRHRSPVALPSLAKRAPPHPHTHTRRSQDNQSGVPGARTTSMCSGVGSLVSPHRLRVSVLHFWSWHPVRPRSSGFSINEILSNFAEGPLLNFPPPYSLQSHLVTFPTLHPTSGDLSGFFSNSSGRSLIQGAACRWIRNLAALSPLCEPLQP